MEQDGGIQIPLKKASWELIVQALTYLVEKPHLDDLEEERDQLGDVLRYIERRLEMRWPISGPSKSPTLAARKEVNRCKHTA